MSYRAKFTGWQDLTLADLLVAYRKAKADCFFENSFPTAIKFADYEQNLLANLGSLLEQLKASKGFADNSELLGDFRLLPKKLSIEPKDNIESGHIYFSNPIRAFESLIKNNKLIPEFRVVGDFPVDAHIVSALWINTIGHKFDACLDESCYGARLQRIHNDESLDEQAEKPFHISSIGSFAPYFQPYQRWRNDGLKAIRNELENGRNVIAVSLDLKSYYHYIDPLTLTSVELHNKLGLVGENALSAAEQLFTSELAVFLDKWSDGANKFAASVLQNTAKNTIPGGLVIGLTASRIISNILLHYWDILIKQKVTPIHYGRYVDDMFLVLHDTGCIKDTSDFMSFLHERLGRKLIFKENVNKKNSPWKIQLGKKLQKNTQIKLQAEKQKLFILQGQAGLDLLDSIEKDIYELSSERRLMPSPDQLEDSTATRVLSAAGSVGEQADTLRRADGLTIRRLSWSLRLRDVETLARDLPVNEWKSQREEFFQFAYNHILRADKLFAHFDNLPRLLGFAISLNEWSHAEQIVTRSFESLDQLADQVNKREKDVAINGLPTKTTMNLWRFVKGSLTWIFVDSAARHYDPKRLLDNERSIKESRLAKLFLKNIFEQLSTVKDILKFEFGSEDFYVKAPSIAIADLAKNPYKRILNTQSAPILLGKKNSKKERKVLKSFDDINLVDTKSLKLFLNSTSETRLAFIKKNERKSKIYLPYLFPTRPYTPGEIAELAPECVGLPCVNGKTCAEPPAVIWARYTKAIRGVWVKPTLLAVKQHKSTTNPKRSGKKQLHIGTDHKKKIVVALTNLKTDDSDWAAMAHGKPNLSLHRYHRISELVNQAINLPRKPDYVLFPELSLPISWVNSIASRLSSVGISLIAGTEYRQFSGNKIFSEVCLVLTDNRLGFPASVKIWQPKLEPAVGEDKELISKFGKHWHFTKLSTQLKKPIYVHNGMYFGIMMCSELQNSKVRISFQGEVDALMVLSWNQDLETFSSLVEATALDTHAYIVLVNNRKFGDSRVRSPAKESFMRDLARVRGGDNDFVVAATLDIDALRAFQSRAKRWPQKGDKFKPLPEGFKLNSRRKKAPS